MILELFYGRPSLDTPFSHLATATSLAFECTGIICTYGQIEVVFSWGDAYMNNEHEAATQAMEKARSLTGWEYGVRDYSLVMRRAEGDDSDMIVTTNAEGVSTFFSDFSLE